MIMAKDKDYIRLIHTSQWLKLRRRKLTACPLCERCQEEGRVMPAAEVHHIVPVEDGLTLREKESLMYDYNNRLALCHECHVAIHKDMGRGGKKHSKRVQLSHLERFKRKFLNGAEK